MHERTNEKETRPRTSNPRLRSYRIPPNPVVNFQRLKNSTTSIKQSSENICQAGIDKVDINKRQSDITTIKDDCYRDTITGDNGLEQKDL